MTWAIEQLLHDLYALCRFITLMIHKSFESFSFHSNLYFSLSHSLSRSLSVWIGQLVFLFHRCFCSNAIQSILFQIEAFVATNNVYRAHNVRSLLCCFGQTKHTRTAKRRGRRYNVYALVLLCSHYIVRYYEFRFFIQQFNACVRTVWRKKKCFLFNLSIVYYDQFEKNYSNVYLNKGKLLCFIISLCKWWMTIQSPN